MSTSTASPANATSTLANTRGTLTPVCKPVVANTLHTRYVLPVSASTANKNPNAYVTTHWLHAELTLNVGTGSSSTVSPKMPQLDRATPSRITYINSGCD